MRRRDLFGFAAVVGSRGGMAQVVGRSGKRLALLTSARRDVVAAAWQEGADVAAPASEAHLLERPMEFWNSFANARFHDYAMLNPKVVTRAVPVTRKVRGGDRFTFEGQEFRVLDTPGVTRGAVSYLTEERGKRVAYSGDLMYPGGRLLDLHSLQDAIPEARLRGYHGYAARAGELIQSLRLIAAEKPERLIPTRGPAIDDPLPQIEKLIERLKRALGEHFTTDALRWYFGDDSLRLRAAQLLEGDVPAWMPMSETRPLPEWVRAIGNSRLLISKERTGFLIDCGYDRVIDEIRGLVKEGVLDRLEGIFVTHYHDDHTDRVQLCAEAFGCPVYCHERMRDILERPSAYYLPALTKDAIRVGKPQAHGATLPWREFGLTFFDFPGQTLYHGAMLAQRDSGERILFAGDSFTPSGLDDYCLRNRNFLGEKRGYFECMRQLAALPQDTFLVNQHVEPMFRFSARQLDFMKGSLERRRREMAELLAWPHPDFGLDDQWVRFSPYEARVTAGRALDLEMVVLNHAATAQPFEWRPVLPAGWRARGTPGRTTLAPRKETRLSLRVQTPETARGLGVVCADIRLGGVELREWTEALVRVE